METARSIALFVLAAIAKIGGAYLVWQGVRRDRGLLAIAVGIAALGANGFVATLQPDKHFGRVLLPTEEYLSLITRSWCGAMPQRLQASWRTGSAGSG